MRIAIAVGEFPVLWETFVLNLIGGLIERGHHVDVFAESAGDTSTMHPDVMRYGLLQRTTYQPWMPRTASARFRSAVRRAGAALRQDWRLVLRSLDVLRYGRQAASLQLFYGALPLLGRPPYDIYHCQFGTMALRWLPLFARSFVPGKLVTSFRGYDISQFLQMHGAAVYRPLFDRGDLFLPNCEFFRRRLIELGCDPRRTVVYRSGVDCRRFAFRPRKPASGEPVRIASVGRLVEKKGIEYGLRAAARLIGTGRPVEYHVVGDGPLREYLQQLAGALSIRPHVVFHGGKPQNELIALLERAHLFVAPSVTAADGDQDAPMNTLKEAMALGLPVIGTRHGGILELIEDGVSGFLVPERDEEALADRLQFLLEAPERWVQIGEAGRAVVERHYNLDRLNDDLVHLYEQALGSSPGAGV